MGMALHGTINNMKDLLHRITQDLTKAESGNKAASQRVRTNTVRLEKIGKLYRKESITFEKSNKGPRKAKSGKKMAHKPKVKPAKKAAAKPKAKPKAKSASARPRALSFKKPTAKLPARKPSFR